MNQSRNFQKELDGITDALRKEGRVPRLLIHACCAPCSSYVLEYLSAYFQIDVYYYNPNIDTEEEFEKREAELDRLIAEMPFEHPVKLIGTQHGQAAFLDICAGLENEPERGRRCLKCYELRLRKTAEFMLEENRKGAGYEYFATTLTLSPLKNAAALNEIGERVAAEYGLKYLVSDFKKKDGFKRSIVLSREYELYRQNYCGCRFSKAALKAEF